jgi:phospho-N-acetylmuramoyl-pentapeptide-transferase
MVIDIVKVIFPAALAFSIGVALTPLLTHYLYRFKAWKKVVRSKALSGEEAVVFQELHKEKEIGTPRMGGIIIWASAGITIVGIWLIARFVDGDTFSKLDFLSRNQTWIPFFTLMIGSVVGLADDFLEVSGKGSYIGGGLSLTKRLLIVTLLSLFVGWWFYDKLDVVGIGLPFAPDLYLGVLIIPLFILVALALYASGVIDGLDGLAGGVFAIVFLAYAGIAFYQAQIDLAAFCATVAGAILAFLWFNIPPARFYMSETGTMGLTVTLATVAFMTDSLGDGHGVIVLPLVAFPLFITVVSVVLQMLSKKFRGKKLFHIAPLHHHFEALGWPSYKVTMRYWVLGIVTALIGVIVALIG